MTPSGVCLQNKVVHYYVKYGAPLVLNKVVYYCVKYGMPLMFDSPFECG